MRFWITKNSEVPVHEQLVRQVMLAILSEDLPAGHKLPSIRALARRCGIHSNTVSAAYHHLVDQGWLEVRPGSGIFVARTHTIANPDAGALDALLTDTLQRAREQGYRPEDVLRRLEQLLLPRSVQRIAIVETDPGMQDILQEELREHLPVPVDVLVPADLASFLSRSTDICLVGALATRAASVRESLPRGVPFLPLRLRSVAASLQAETRPSSEIVISIVSRSRDFRNWARAVLIAVGLEPDSLSDVDTSADDWRERAVAGSWIIADALAARSLPPGCAAKVFRVLADSCIAELRQLCQAPVALAKVPQI
jgi:GntR family transcriptional regulator